ncbi:hypothetical protein BT96DRAFT_973156 [Gymnopus androsaceus JB14]|uniref:DUF6535 domain-containing protein n=1 Tax=Gymnopus androsaceus JB14 TaxID=1447944 RepID=A0A6A4I3J7_9AGAR|nr:hypothetical protein BT96DRAFT_973156 [Gymnopus androsaceus JB14]
MASRLAEGSGRRDAYHDQAQVFMDSHPESNGTALGPADNVRPISAVYGDGEPASTYPNVADTICHPANTTLNAATSVDLGLAEMGIGIEFVPTKSTGQGTTRPRWTARLFALKNNKLKQPTVHGMFGAGNHAYDYKEKYPEDEWGAEMHAESRFYKTYLDEKDVFDNDRITAWRDALDVLLIIIGLFSAIVTSFVIQTSQTLQGPNYDQITAVMVYNLILVQESLANGSPLPIIQNPTDTPVSPSAANVWVNALWFTSLSISLSAALLAILTKQWLYHYMAPTSGTSQERVRIQQFRLSGLEKYHVPMIIDLLPITLHISIALFLVGLALFLSTIHIGMAIAISVVTGIAYTAYIGSIILSLVDPQCPYQSPISTYLYHPWIFMVDASGILLHVIYLGVSITSILLGAVKDFSLQKFRSLHMWISAQISGALEKCSWIPRICKWLKGWLNAQRQTHPFSSQEQQNLAVLQNRQQLDIDAIAWLFSKSSNSTVRDISLQAVVGLMPSDAETRKLTDVIQPYFELQLHSACYVDYYGVYIVENWEQYNRIMQLTCLSGLQVDRQFALALSDNNWHPKEHDGHQVFNQIIIPSFYRQFSSNHFNLGAFLSPGPFSKIFTLFPIQTLMVTHQQL